MLRRITTTILAALVASISLVGSAWALPGEGYGVDPYGIPTTAVRPPSDPAVVETVTGWVLSPVALVAALVVTAAVMAAAGFFTGAVRQRRLALR